MIFICFSHIERYIVAQSLSYHLKNYGYQVWYDYDKLFIGDDGDYINCEEGLHKSKYVVIIVSRALFKSPCAISELEQIYSLFMKKKIIVIPILYNIIAQDIPENFQWINDIIYTEITNENGTLDVATQIAAKCLEDIIRNSSFKNLNNIIIKPSKYSNYLECLISCYLKIDSNNINARIATLYSLYLFLYNFFDLSNTPSYYSKGIDYICEKTNLNLPINFKELSIIENCVIILLNLVN